MKFISKRIVEEIEISPRVYPYLGLYGDEGLAVIFVRENCGLTIASCTLVSSYTLGERVQFRTNWCESNFQPAPVGYKLEIAVECSELGEYPFLASHKNDSGLIIMFYKKNLGIILKTQYEKDKYAPVYLNSEEDFTPCPVGFKLELTF